MHQNTAISEQSSEVLGNTVEFVILMNYDVVHQYKVISEQSSKFLCKTDKLWPYASKQSYFRTKF